MIAEAQGQAVVMLLVEECEVHGIEHSKVEYISATNSSFEADGMVSFVNREIEAGSYLGEMDEDD